VKWERGSAEERAGHLSNDRVISDFVNCPAAPAAITVVKSIIIACQSRLGLICLRAL